MTDIDALEKIAFEPSIWALGMNHLQERADLYDYIASALEDKKQEAAYPFLITDKRNGQVAGSTRFGNISIANKRLEIGWTWIHPQFQGTGLNRACKYLLLEYVFDTLLFNRVEIKTDVLNHQSRKAILKMGATQEGIFRKHQVTAGGRIRDSIYFSILNDEWPDIRARIFGLK